jgi:hypothetical protein
MFKQNRQDARSARSVYSLRSLRLGGSDFKNGGGGFCPPRPPNSKLRVYKFSHRFSSRCRFDQVTRCCPQPADDLFGSAYRHRRTARSSLYDIRQICPDDDEQGERQTYSGSATYLPQLGGVSISCWFRTYCATRFNVVRCHDLQRNPSL